MLTKTMVCLANSRKLHGRCVAGREIGGASPGAWIRPISDREAQEVSEYERQYPDGSDPRSLDIIEVPLLEHRPGDYQRENWLLNPQYYWRKAGVFSRERLHQLAEDRGPLWCNGFSTWNGKNDRIPLEKAVRETSSLKLIRVESVRLTVLAPGIKFDNPKRRVQARFHFGGIEYAFRVTDPIIERQYLARDDGSYELAGVQYLTVSLGEPFMDYSYKLAAAILEGPR